MKGQADQKAQASRGVVILLFPALALSKYMPLTWHLETSDLTRLDHIKGVFKQAV
jgi:hypothetical protein